MAILFGFAGSMLELVRIHFAVCGGAEPSMNSERFLLACNFFYGAPRRIRLQVIRLTANSRRPPLAALAFRLRRKLAHRCGLRILTHAKQFACSGRCALCLKMLESILNETDGALRAPKANSLGRGGQKKGYGENECPSHPRFDWLRKKSAATIKTKNCTKLIMLL
jgi:hypothetical protein